MYLQGSLQTMFDALFHMGVIDPVLEMDWDNALDEMLENMEEYSEVISVANTHQNNMDSLMLELEKFDEKTLGYLAIEVAREFADYHSREEIQ